MTLGLKLAKAIENVSLSVYVLFKLLLSKVPLRTYYYVFIFSGRLDFLLLLSLNLLRPLKVVVCVLQ